MRVCALLLALCGPAAAEESAWTDYEQGLKAFHRGDLEQAEKLFHAAVRSDSRVVDAHYYLGLCLERRGEAKAAGEHYTQVTDAYPTYGSAQSRLGRLALVRGDRKAAVGHFSVAAELRPDLDAWMQVGSLWIDLGDFAKAESALEKAKKFSPDDVNLAAVFGRLYVETNRWKEAHDRFAAVVKRIPSDAASLYMCAVCLEKLERGPEGLETLEKVLELDPLHKSALRRLAEAYAKDERTREKAERYRKRLEWVERNPPKIVPPAPERRETPERPPVEAAAD